MFCPKSDAPFFCWYRIGYQIHLHFQSPETALVLLTMSYKYEVGCMYKSHPLHTLSWGIKKAKELSANAQMVVDLNKSSNEYKKHRQSVKILLSRIIAISKSFTCLEQELWTHELSAPALVVKFHNQLLNATFIKMSSWKH